MAYECAKGDVMSLQRVNLLRSLQYVFYCRTHKPSHKPFREGPRALHYGFITSNLQKLIRKSIWNQLAIIMNLWKKHKLVYVTISEGV